MNFDGIEIKRLVGGVLPKAFIVVWRADDGSGLGRWCDTAKEVTERRASVHKDTGQRAAIYTIRLL
jgi:hypothetical protein